MPWVLDQLIESLQVPSLGRIGPAHDVTDFDDPAIDGEERLITQVRDADEHAVCPSAARIALVFGLSVRNQSKTELPEFQCWDPELFPSHPLMSGFAVITDAVSVNGLGGVTGEPAEGWVIVG